MDKLHTKINSSDLTYYGISNNRKRALLNRKYSQITKELKDSIYYQNSETAMTGILLMMLDNWEQTIWDSSIIEHAPRNSAGKWQEGFFSNIGKITQKINKTSSQLHKVFCCGNKNVLLFETQFPNQALYKNGKFNTSFNPQVNKMYSKNPWSRFDAFIIGEHKITGVEAKLFSDISMTISKDIKTAKNFAINQIVRNVDTLSNLVINEASPFFGYEFEYCIIRPANLNLIHKIEKDDMDESERGAAISYMQEYLAKYADKNKLKEDLISLSASAIRECADRIGRLIDINPYSIKQVTWKGITDVIRDKNEKELDEFLNLDMAEKKPRILATE